MFYFETQIIFMELHEIEREICILKLKILSDKLKFKRKNRQTHDRYFYMSLLFVEELLSVHKFDRAKEALRDMKEKLPDKCKTKKKRDDGKLKKKNSFLQPNDGFGKMLPGVE